MDDGSPENGIREGRRKRLLDVGCWTLGIRRCQKLRMRLELGHVLYLSLGMCFIYFAISNPPSISPMAFPTIKDVLDRSEFPQILTSNDCLCTVSLTYDELSPDTILRSIRSPAAGANVLFLGTTRNSFNGRPVSRLSYSAYPALALRSFLRIAENTHSAYGLEKIYIVHRLGEVAVEEESIAVAVSAGHRGPAWKGAEEILERCKERVEVWKMEEFEGEAAGSGEWRANNDIDSDGKMRAA